MTRRHIASSPELLPGDPRGTPSIPECSRGASGPPEGSRGTPGDPEKPRAYFRLPSSHNILRHISCAVLSTTPALTPLSGDGRRKKQKHGQQDENLHGTGTMQCPNDAKGLQPIASAARRMPWSASSAAAMASALARTMRQQAERPCKCCGHHPGNAGDAGPAFGYGNIFRKPGRSSSQRTP